MLQSEFARLEQGMEVRRTLQSEFACLEQGIEVPRTLQSEFAGLEDGFTGVTGKIVAASGCFLTTGGERKSYSIPSGQNRTRVHASEERGGEVGD
jgi:hypothetical protein